MLANSERHIEVKVKLLQVRDCRQHDATQTWKWVVSFYGRFSLEELTPVPIA
jgi:hypothetical protein